MRQGTRASRTFKLRPVVDAARDREGAAAVEFALVLPALLLMMFGIINFGIALNQYLELTDGVREGGRTFAISRSSATPYTSTTTAITSAAANLTAGSITITVQVNGVACTTNAGCSTALTAAPGGAATVIATYPVNLNFLAFNYAPSANLTSTTTDLIE